MLLRALIIFFISQHYLDAVQQTQASKDTNFVKNVGLHPNLVFSLTRLIQPCFSTFSFSWSHIYIAHLGPCLLNF